MIPTRAARPAVTSEEARPVPGPEAVVVCGGAVDAETARGGAVVLWDDDAAVRDAARGHPWFRVARATAA